MREQYIMYHVIKHTVQIYARIVKHIYKPYTSIVNAYN